MLDRWMRCGVCVLLAFGLSGCLYQDLEVMAVEEFSQVRLSLEGLQAQMNVDVFNPNPFAVTVTEADVALYIEEGEVGDVTLLKPTAIRPNARATVSLQVRTRDGALGQVLKNDVLTLLRGGRLPVKAEGVVKGKAFGLSFSFPLTHDQTMNFRP